MLVTKAKDQLDEAAIKQSREIKFITSKLCQQMAAFSYILCRLMACDQYLPSA